MRCSMRRRSSSIRVSPGTLIGERAARAALPAKLLMQPGETRQHILQICGFHLQPRLPRTCPLRKNPQNQRSAVDDLPVKRIHQILHLHRRECVIEQNHVRLLHSAAARISCILPDPMYVPGLTACHPAQRCRPPPSRRPPQAPSFLSWTCQNRHPPRSACRPELLFPPKRNLQFRSSQPSRLYLCTGDWLISRIRFTRTSAA